jgi:hypothetical protein
MSYRPLILHHLTCFHHDSDEAFFKTQICRSIGLKPWFSECNVTYLSSNTQPEFRMKNAPDADFLIFDLGNVIIDIDYNRAFELIKSLLPPIS